MARAPASATGGLPPPARAAPAEARPAGLHEARRVARPGLSARLLALTLLFVMLAEVLIYVPSVANFRRNWLNDRLAAAQVAALVLDAAPSGALPPDLANRLLAAVGARAVAVRAGETRRLLAMDAGSEPSVDVARNVDLREASAAMLIRDAFAVLLRPADAPIRVIGPGAGAAGRGGADSVEIVVDEAPLRRAMLVFSRNILLLSLFISGLTAGLVYLALQWVIVRPVRRLTGHITAFAEDPEDLSRVAVPSGRTDEIGVAERALAGMQHALAGELRAKRRLAELGLAVAKINHELRNMLTTAQLLTDRLEATSDPAVRRVAPRLMATIGRAIAFCGATLAYGRLAEQAPRRLRLALRPLVAELPDQVGPGAGRIAFTLDVPDDLVVDADPDQLHRVLVNLVGNAAEALQGAGTDAPAIRLTARRRGGAVAIRVEDNGPGVPARARAHLFQPFQGSARPGGTGLGLAVAAELVRGHGGTITLLDRPVGAAFEVVVPDRG